jgi:hypothetical protein
MEFRWLEGAQIEGKKQTAAFRRKAAVVVADPAATGLTLRPLQRTKPFEVDC